MYGLDRQGLPGMLCYHDAVSCCQAVFWELAVLTVRVAELLQERDTNH